jgi:hypothetical protein
MKNILIIILLAFSISAQSQSRIGYPLDSLKKEFSNPTYHAMIVRSGNNLSFQIVTKESKVIYLCDSTSKICEVTIIYPFSSKVKDMLISRYNENYISLSPTQWQNKDDGIVFEISLSQDRETEQTCFIWTYRVEPASTINS